MPRLLAFVLLWLAVPLHSQELANPPDLQQSDTGIRRFELGGTVSNVPAGCAGTTGCPSAALGFGASINLNHYFAFDANVNATSTSNLSTSLTGGRLSEYLFGIRAEIRARRYGYFIKAQPGVLNWNHVILRTERVSPTPPGTPIKFIFGGVNRFATNFGAGFEYSPTERVHVRTEVGELVTLYGSNTWDHNLQSTAGVYFELGKPIVWAPPVYDATKSHRFFGRENEVLILASVLAMTADSITTQHLVSHGKIEGDPLARPFVKYGWSGQISLEALEVSAEILGMYGLHRINLHWLERLAPVTLATAHGILAYQNSQTSDKSSSTTP